MVSYALTPHLVVRPRSSLGKRRGPGAPRASERLKGGLLFLHDLEEAVQLGDLEHLVDLRVDVAQDQLAAGRLQLLVEGDELAECGAGEVFDVGEVEQDLAPTLLVDEAEELLADDLDVLLVQDLAIDEVHDGDVADVFHLEAAATSGRRHTSLLG